MYTKEKHRQPSSQCRENTCQPRVAYLVKLSNENNVKDCSDKQHREIWGSIIHPIYARRSNEHEKLYKQQQYCNNIPNIVGEQ